MERQLIVYQNDWIISQVYSLVAQSATEITNTDKLEHQIIMQVGGYLLLNEDGAKHRRHIVRLITREIAKAKKEHRIQQSVSISTITQVNEEGSAEEYEPRDDLAIVDTAALEIKETINLLAKADRRKEVILSEWANGNTNDSDISNTLARILGGQARSHCRYIQRFRIECQTALTAV